MHTLPCQGSGRTLRSVSPVSRIQRVGLPEGFIHQIVQSNHRNFHVVVTAVLMDVYNDLIVHQAEKYEIIDFIVKMDFRLILS
ncbi:hypothetical protein Hhal_0323 [Halorhodospira halophila SL1]|uniref:Uncharacterized protein n=1 Tax=Halorhodospira halophila (strain DSM 244 / SL1) TaxID=349124 RepID=A1WTV5_HALHL|nr:hypothetical protein Hhal_0323 [Halorhodospira halophila SL1]